jgi:intracellular sulfur oxidation DsrE/DsrF family protein
MNTENKQRVINFLNEQKFSSTIDFTYFLSNEDFETFEDIQSILDDNNALDVEIIYYSNAIEFLKENDNSLRESLQIASELGYEVKNLNSELLASLLASQMLREEFSEIQSEIESLIEEINEEEESEEN